MVTTMVHVLVATIVFHIVFMVFSMGFMMVAFMMFLMMNFHRSWNFHDVVMLVDDWLGLNGWTEIWFRILIMRWGNMGGFIAVHMIWVRLLIWLLIIWIFLIMWLLLVIGRGRRRRRRIFLGTVILAAELI